jgi:hypothetical protein
MISARLLAATVAALAPASVAGFDHSADPESLDASPRRTYFGPNRHNRSLLAAFVAHHGRAEVASYFDKKKRLVVTDYQYIRPLPKYFRLKRDETDLTWPWDHSRFDALGPVLQCPPAIFTSFGQGDGEKRICGLPHDASAQQAIGAPGSPQCVVISIGSKNWWDFERAVSAAMPHCVIHTLDCTVKLRVPPALRNKVHPHQICLGEKTETVRPRGLRFMTWGDFVAHIQLKAPPVALKMDIEGYEWGVLPALALEQRTMLPLSISFEFHYQTQMKLHWFGRYRSPYEIAAFVDFMYTRGGYSLVDRHDNQMCRHCSEIILARV